MQINYLCKVILKTLGIFYNGAKKADILLQNVTENYHLNAVWTHVECDMTCSTILQPQPSDTLELHDIMRHLQCLLIQHPHIDHHLHVIAVKMLM